MEEICCSVCERRYFYDRKKGHTKTKCNSCLVNERRFKLKKKCVEYKGGKCIKCGYAKYLQALHFHHLDPTQKDFNISGSHARSWIKIKEELDKCVLLCAICHIEEHVENRIHDSG